MKLKICGVRNQEMLDFCEESGVDYVGFNFVPSSKRRIDVGSELLNQEFSGKKVALFMNQSLEDVQGVLENFKPDVLQFHGDEDLEFLQKVKSFFDGEIWKAVKIDEDFNVSELEGLKDMVDVFLFDAKTPGAGKVISDSGALNDAIEFCKENNLKFAIAGGINAENIAEFAKNYPAAEFLDTASGVEDDKEFSEEGATSLLTDLRNND
ncbi:MAG: phosphoribosylanthranilate isomerase [Candidatus Peregrinibacteria bacterium]|nr:phosphoribosylanthranilate isomerase [Candidatus Peregrinibacteria bacterium]